MGTLQDELLRVGVVRREDYAVELKLQELHSELRPLARRWHELEHKLPFLPKDNLMDGLLFMELHVARTIQEKKRVLERIVNRLESL